MVTQMYSLHNLPRHQSCAWDAAFLHAGFTMHQPQDSSDTGKIVQSALVPLHLFVIVLNHTARVHCSQIQSLYYGRCVFFGLRQRFTRCADCWVSDHDQCTPCNLTYEGLFCGRKAVLTGSKQLCMQRKQVSEMACKAGMKPGPKL